MAYVFEEEKRSEGSYRGSSDDAFPGAFAITGPGVAADEDVLLKHGVSPTSCYSNEDEESVPSSHIGDVRDVPANNDNGSRINNARDRWEATPKETRKKYAIFTLVGVLCIMVIALAAVVAVGAAKGRAMEKQYGQYASMQGPPPGVDISGYSGGEGGPPPGVDISQYTGGEGGPPPGVDISQYTGEGPPPGVDIQGYDGEGPPPGVATQGNEGEGPPPGADISQYTGEGPPAGVVTEEGNEGGGPPPQGDAEGGGEDEQPGPPSWVDTEEYEGQAPPEWVQYMIDGVEEASSTATTSPTSSPTAKASGDAQVGADEDIDTSDSYAQGGDAADDDTWSGLWADGGCLDGFAEVWCCFTTMCSDDLRGP